MKIIPPIRDGLGTGSERREVISEMYDSNREKHSDDLHKLVDSFYNNLRDDSSEGYYGMEFYYNKLLNILEAYSFVEGDTNAREIINDIVQIFYREISHSNKVCSFDFYEDSKYNVEPKVVFDYLDDIFSKTGIRPTIKADNSYDYIYNPCLILFKEVTCDTENYKQRFFEMEERLKTVDDVTSESLKKLSHDKIQSLYNDNNSFFYKFKLFDLTGVKPEFDDQEIQESYKKYLCNFDSDSDDEFSSVDLSGSIDFLVRLSDLFGKKALSSENQKFLCDSFISYLFDEENFESDVLKKGIVKVNDAFNINIGSSDIFDDSFFDSFLDIFINNIEHKIEYEDIIYYLSKYLGIFREFSDKPLKFPESTLKSIFSYFISFDDKVILENKIKEIENILGASRCFDESILQDFFSKNILNNDLNFENKISGIVEITGVTPIFDKNRYVSFFEKQPFSSLACLFGRLSQMGANISDLKNQGFFSNIDMSKRLKDFNLKPFVHIFIDIVGYELLTNETTVYDEDVVLSLYNRLGNDKSDLMKRNLTYLNVLTGIPLPNHLVADSKNVEMDESEKFSEKSEDFLIESKINDEIKQIESYYNIFLFENTFSFLFDESVVQEVYLNMIKLLEASPNLIFEIKNLESLTGIKFDSNNPEVIDFFENFFIENPILYAYVFTALKYLNIKLNFSSEIVKKALIKLFSSGISFDLELKNIVLNILYLAKIDKNTLTFREDDFVFLKHNEDPYPNDLFFAIEWSIFINAPIPDHILHPYVSKVCVNILSRMSNDDRSLIGGKLLEYSNHFPFDTDYFMGAFIDQIFEDGFFEIFVRLSFEKFLKNINLFGDLKQKLTDSINKTEFYKVFLKLKSIQAPSENPDNDPWKNELFPLIEALSEKLKINSAGFFLDKVTSNQLLDYVKKVGMINLPFLAELFFALDNTRYEEDQENPQGGKKVTKPQGDFEKLDDKYITALNEFGIDLKKGERWLYPSPNSLKDVLLKKAEEFLNKLLMNNLDIPLGTRIGKELFKMVIGKNSHTSNDDPNEFLKIWRETIKSKPELENPPAWMLQKTFDVSRIGRQSPKQKEELNEMMVGEEIRSFFNTDIKRFDDGLLYSSVDKFSILSDLNLDSVLNKGDHVKEENKELLEYLKNEGLELYEYFSRLISSEEEFKIEDLLEKMFLHKDNKEVKNILDVLCLGHAWNIAGEGWRNRWSIIMMNNQNDTKEKYNKLKYFEEFITGYIMEHYFNEDQDPDHTGHARFSKELIDYLKKEWNLEKDENGDLKITKIMDKANGLMGRRKLENGKKVKVTKMPVSGMFYLYSGDIGDACYNSLRGNYAKGVYGRIYSWLYVVEKKGGYALKGSCLAIDTKCETDKVPALIVRANNPLEGLIQGLDSEELVLESLKTAVESAKALREKRMSDGRALKPEEKRQRVMIPMDKRSESSTNRQFVNDDYHRRWGNCKEMSLVDESETNMRYNIWNSSGSHPCVVVWEIDGNGKETFYGDWG